MAIGGLGKMSGPDVSDFCRQHGCSVALAVGSTAYSLLGSSKPGDLQLELQLMAAFLVAVPVGLFVGFTLAEVPFLGALLRPLVNFLFGVPKSIFLPVFILVFGVSIPQKIAFGVFTTVFVMIMGGIAAVQSVPQELVTVSRV